MKTDQQHNIAISIPTKPEKRNFTFRLDPTLAEWVKETARENGISQGALLEGLIRNAQNAKISTEPEH